MKRFATIVVLSTILVAGPVMADHGGGNLLSRDNVGGAIGAAVGGFLGSKLGDGKARLATTAAGAVGGFLIGENVARNYRPGGYAPAPSSGPRYTGAYDNSAGYRPASGYNVGHRPSTCCDDDRDYRDRVHPIHETYIAKCTSNIRSGPSTRYHVVGQLHDREPVKVVGKVQGRDWYMVQTGYQRGYVYAPLLRPARYGHNDRGRYGWDDGFRR